LAAGPRNIASALTHGKHRFKRVLYCCVHHVTVTEPLPSNGRVCRAVPLQRLSLLASQFWLSLQNIDILPTVSCRSRHCLVCCDAHVLRWADSPSKKSYRKSLKITGSEVNYEWQPPKRFNPQKEKNLNEITFLWLIYAIRQQRNATRAEDGSHRKTNWNVGRTGYSTIQAQQSPRKWSRSSLE
jgi:hypothetical protein